MRIHTVMYSDCSAASPYIGMCRGLRLRVPEVSSATRDAIEPAGAVGAGSCRAHGQQAKRASVRRAELVLVATVLASQAAWDCFQAVSVRRIALRMVRSLRIQATKATFFGLPALSKR